MKSGGRSKFYAVRSLYNFEGPSVRKHLPKAYVCTSTLLRPPPLPRAWKGAVLGGAPSLSLCHVSSTDEPTTCPPHSRSSYHKHWDHLAIHHPRKVCASPKQREISLLTDFQYFQGAYDTHRMSDTCMHTLTSAHSPSHLTLSPAPSHLHSHLLTCTHTHSGPGLPR